MEGVNWHKTNYVPLLQIDPSYADVCAVGLSGLESGDIGLWR